MRFLTNDYDSTTNSAITFQQQKITGKLDYNYMSVTKTKNAEKEFNA